MRYIGSKRKLAKELIPLIQSYIKDDTVGYIEPFVGGANVIDKIEHHNKIGIDIHEELIELLKYAQENELPETVTEEEYNKVKDNKDQYPKWYVGLVGFTATFGCKYFGGFARAYDKNNNNKLIDVPAKAINALRIQSQKESFKDIQFHCNDFLNIPIENLEGYVIYCDIPYKDTCKYKTDTFPYDKFYEWVKELSKHNTVLISEYNMPEEFECIWEKPVKIGLGSGVNKNCDLNRMERVYIYRNNE